MLGCIFPGQGSQHVGMLNELAQNHAVVSEIFKEASELLKFDLWRLVQDGPDSQLNETENTQPALLAAGYSIWKVWGERGGPAPDYLAGHSLGEYTALVCAGALSFADAVLLVRDRGRFMQQAVAPGAGAMAAILGLEDDAVRAVCKEVSAGEIVDCANFNSPGQVVIAGTASAVERAVSRCKELGSKRVVLLSVSVPSHSMLMKPAADRLAERLDRIVLETPRLPVIHNADVETHAAPEDIRPALVAQLFKPVRWVEVMRTLAEAGVEKCVEFGPGKVLTGLCRRIDKRLEGYAVFDPGTFDKALAAMNPV